MPVLVAKYLFMQITWPSFVTEQFRVEVEIEPRNQVDFDWNDVLGRAHSCRHPTSDSCVLQQHIKYTIFANVWQLDIVSREEVYYLARVMKISDFDPEWLGANMVLSGCPDFSISAWLQIINVTKLVVDMQNYLRQQILINIECDLPGHSKSFKQYAKGRRGVTAWVERPGQLAFWEIDCAYINLSSVFGIRMVKFISN